MGGGGWGPGDLELPLGTELKLDNVLPSELENTKNIK